MNCQVELGVIIAALAMRMMPRHKSSSTMYRRRLLGYLILNPVFGLNFLMDLVIHILMPLIERFALVTKCTSYVLMGKLFALISRMNDGSPC